MLVSLPLSVFFSCSLCLLFRDRINGMSVSAKHFTANLHWNEVMRKASTTLWTSFFQKLKNSHIHRLSSKKDNLYLLNIKRGKFIESIYQNFSLKFYFQQQKTRTSGKDQHNMVWAELWCPWRRPNSRKTTLYSKVYYTIRLYYTLYTFWRIFTLNY